MPKELVRPATTIVSAIVDKAISPALRDVEKDLGESLPTTVTFWTPHMEGPKVLVTGQGTLESSLAETPRGEMRLSFRETAVEGRLLFFGEAVYQEGISPTTGFSGFDVRGVVRADGRDVRVEDDSWTIKYKVWRFHGWK